MELNNSSEKPTLNNVLDALQNKFGAQIISVEQQFDFPVITIEKKAIVPVVQFLYDDPSFKFRFLTTLCGIHFPDRDLPYCMMYQLHSLENNLRIRLKAYTSENELEFDSLIPIFPGANWMEREAFDFYGIRFKGHPKMTRILNVEDMDYHPMRKEYPVEDLTRYDKDDTLFGRDKKNYNPEILMKKKQGLPE